MNLRYSLYACYMLMHVSIFSIAETKGQPRCGSRLYIDWLNSRYPGYADAMENHYREIVQASLQKSNESDVYDIPVVVHVVYNQPAQNLPDSVVTRQIEILNRDYSRNNEDTINLRGIFSGVHASDANIRFHLATTDPQGQPSNGITRTSTTLSSFANFQAILGNLSSIERVKSTADGGIDPWDTSRYLNIWVCNMAFPLLGVSLLGYATPPPGLPNWPIGSTGGLNDGVVIQFEAFSDNNPNPLVVGGTTEVVKGRTTVHEVGHYLGLRHIWGDNSDCVADDGVDDTPLCTSESNFDCDTTKNTCIDTSGIDWPDMVENYMDYSAETCQNTFTKGQVNIMRTVCSDYRTELPQITNGLRMHRFRAELRACPNPSADGFIRITGIPANTRQVHVLNIKGSIISTLVLTQGNTCDLSSFPSGIYFVQPQGSYGMLKVVKQ